jgi:hypothetical protein
VSLGLSDIAWDVTGGHAFTDDMKSNSRDCHTSGKRWIEANVFSHSGLRRKTPDRYTETREDATVRRRCVPLAVICQRETALSGCSSAWLERLVWDQEVAGSNPVIPIELTSICEVV